MEENNIKDKAYKRGLIIIIILLMLLVFTSIVLAQTLYGTVSGNSFTIGTIKIDIGYFNYIEEEGGIVEIGPYYTKNTDEITMDFIKNHALINNNPNPKDGEVASEEVFKSFEEGEERYDLITRKIVIKNDSFNEEFYRLYFDNRPNKLTGKLLKCINVKIIDVTDDAENDELNSYIGNYDNYMPDICEENDPEHVLLYDGVANEFVSSNPNLKAFGKLEPNSTKTLLIRFTYPSEDDLSNPEKVDNQYEYSLKFDLCAEAVQAKNQFGEGQPENLNDVKFN